MENADLQVFCLLYREAYSRCFGGPLTQPLTETEGKLFQQQLLDHTGLTVGWRSLKNYSIFILNDNGQENPSVASMDTLARYVLKAPYTNEIQRKDTESHHPYWFLYRERHLAAPVLPEEPKKGKSLVWAFLVALLLLVAGYSSFKWRNYISVHEDFKDVSEQVLLREWQVLNKQEQYWARRNDVPGLLTMFTLNGDNWPDSSSALPKISNLLVRNLPAGCFMAELYMEDFIPMAEWQQAGILLLEDTTLTSKAIRVSLAYNDFFGGYKRPKEILVQGITTSGSNKPEEFVHNTVLTLDSLANKDIIAQNMKRTALRIEKQGSHFRLLYAGGAGANAAYKEIGVKELNIEPRFIALFALKGNIDSTPVVPVKMKKFKLESIECE
ncbi:hypothetical protein [Mucilaginibacter pedocola]|uniref:Uncharacterized protein n=1 Tax=Mucilaginibacter pedocola TaxID=1792845 RepID=A0A1S9PM57_9SPHI|nr:hypothetical protein [Mucilaginibacter pedocola]OOQ62042.1 hypothetical protein BC343_03040 [Mucilaginibacter pedocola]